MGHMVFYSSPSNPFAQTNASFARLFDGSNQSQSNQHTSLARDKASATNEERGSFTLLLIIDRPLVIFVIIRNKHGSNATLLHILDGFGATFTFDENFLDGLRHPDV